MKGVSLPSWSLDTNMGRQTGSKQPTIERIISGKRKCYKESGLSLWLSWQRICLQCRKPGFNPWIRRIPWRRERLPTPVLWPGEFHGLYIPWGHKKLDTTEQLSLSLINECYHRVRERKQHGLSKIDHNLHKPLTRVKVAQSCPTLCDPMDYTVHGILQARVLEWVAFPCSRGFSQPKDRTQVSQGREIF